MIPSRFVILHHVQEESEHWDLMLEQGGVLLSWQLPVNPTKPNALPVDAIRIADHRIDYLEYEGPISGGRGTVSRIDAGLLQIQDSSETCIVFDMESVRFQGRFRLEKVTEFTWRLNRNNIFGDCQGSGNSREL